MAELEAALVAQKSFWKLAGVATLAMFVLGVLFAVGMFTFAMFAMPG